MLYKNHGAIAYSRECGAGVEIGDWLGTTAKWIGSACEERWEGRAASKLVAELLSKRRHLS